MLIGIDAHYLEGNRTGVGRYLFNLLKIWSQIKPEKYFHTLEYENISTVRFVLYFKDEIPKDLPSSEFFELKLLRVSSTAKFIHWDLCWAAKKDKADILFCPGYIAPIFFQGKIALTLHDIIYQAHPEWYNWPSLADRILLKWVSKISAKKATIIFTISEFSKKEILKYYEANPEKVILTYLAADINLDDIQGDIEAVKNRYHIKKKFVFFVGSIFDRRHLSEIIEGFCRFAKEQPDYQLLIGGRDYTKKRIIDKLIAGKNKILGHQAILRVDFVPDRDLKLLYSACAFFIYLSDYEGFGLPVLEAMAAGTPVVTSEGSSFREVAAEAALLIKNNSDVEEIYQAIKKMTEDEKLRHELIKRGKEQAARFSWERCAEETLAALMDLRFKI